MLKLLQPLGLVMFCMFKFGAMFIAFMQHDIHSVVTVSRPAQVFVAKIFFTIILPIIPCVVISLS